MIPQEQKLKTTFIKLDLESGEYDALNGATDVIAAGRPLIVTEFGGNASGTQYGFSGDEFFSFMRAIGYTCFDLFGEPYTVEDYYDSTVIGAIVAVPNEKLDTNIHKNIGLFTENAFKRP